MGENLMIIMLLGAYSGAILKQLALTGKETFTEEEVADASVKAMTEFQKMLESKGESKTPPVDDAFDMGKNG